MERMEKQTAVEWLDYQLFIKHGEITIEDINKAKQMEKAEKIKAQIDILKLAHLRLSVEGIDKADNTMVFTVNELEQQLKELEDESKT